VSRVVTQFATDVAGFILALRRCDSKGGPLAGAHSGYRGASPAYYDDEARRCITALSGRIDTVRVSETWQAALEAQWRGTPVWFHGDMGGNNLLVTDGKLSAVIDFGTSGIGDPACDLVIAWTMFREESRGAFRHAVGQDDGTWARARGWALWKSLLMLTQCSDPRDGRVAIHLDVIDAVLADHERFA
jgi:aminoglycoside phosphotransferase (APT) family kinase protein